MIRAHGERCALLVAIFVVACETDIPVGNLGNGSVSSGGMAGDSRSSGPLREDAIALFDFRGGAGAPFQDQRGSLTLAVPDGTDPALLQPGESGLAFTAGGFLVSEEAAAEITAACMASNELTVEVWATPDGPQELRSRLVTLSADALQRNFALGVGSNDGNPGEGECADVSRTAFDVGTGAAAYFFRRRAGSISCEGCSQNGYPELWTELVAEEHLTHVVATRGADGTDRIYVNAGIEAECSFSGDFADWDPTYLLKVGGESMGDDLRPFSSVIHVVVIYDVALPEADVRTLFAAGI